MQNRRDLLKIAAGTALGLTVGTATTSAQERAGDRSGNRPGRGPGNRTFPGSGTRWSELLGWKLGCQVYSFNRFTFEEAVRKNVQTGCRFLEAYPGQKLTGTGGTVGPDMNKEEKKTFRTILADNGCVCTTFGVTGADRKTFDFCAEMGIEVINAEPPKDQLAAIDKLCEEYGIRVSLHNHPEPSIYWDYKTVLEVLKDCSPRIGACADTGHYMRSGINPLEAVKALKGRIIGFHFKDLNNFGRGAHDVPWGTGQADVPALLREIADQKYKGSFSAEYEHNWDNNVPDIAESVRFFDNVAKEILLG